MSILDNANMGGIMWCESCRGHYDPCERQCVKCSAHEGETRLIEVEWEDYCPACYAKAFTWWARTWWAFQDMQSVFNNRVYRFKHWLVP